jgi:SAM-dependent methyltransferase
MRIDDAAAVKEQYAREENLRARQALWEHTTGTDPQEALWRTLQEWQPKRVLEVGGGQGELAERMQAELGAAVTFVDVSPRMVELARARGLDAHEGDAQQLHFPDGAFDTVVAAWMLYHVADVDRALAEFARVLVPGGALVAVTNSLRHNEELFELFGYRWSREGTFSRENGEELLRRRFASVTRVDTEIRAEVRDLGVLERYAESLQGPARPVPDDLPLPFVTHGRTTIFFATT